MKKLLFLMMGIILFGTLTSCNFTDENKEELGNKLNESLSSLKGEESVILKFDVSYHEDDNWIYNIYINKAKDYTGLIFNDMDDIPNYRYIIHDQDGDKDYYYEYHDFDHTFNKVVALGKENYVYDKLCFGKYDIPSLTLSIEEIIDMVNNEQMTLTQVTSDDENLKDLVLYDVTFKLNYFVENNPEVLTGLYGDRASEVRTGDYQQTITIGYDQENMDLKYFAYNQSDVLPGSEVKVKIFVQSVGSAAEKDMEELENSDNFPNQTNITEF